jgi:predicted permease
MAWLWRALNVFRRNRVSREIDEELESHVQDAIEFGRDPAEARRALGHPLRLREESRDVKLLPWLESLLADAQFGLRQLTKNPVTSAAAILSLALAIGACGATFRIADAMLWRPLPIRAADRLFLLSREGIDYFGLPTFDGCEYPLFRRMRDAVAGQGVLIAISPAARTDVTFVGDADLEKVHRQYVSGWMFDIFGVRPAIGRVLTANDDRTPGAHPVAVLSHDFWTRRFGQDPAVVGRMVRLGRNIHEVIGVAEERFTGSDPGVITDIFVPSMMHPGVEEIHNQWTRAFVVLQPGVSAEPVRDRLQAIFRGFLVERAATLPAGFLGRRDDFINQRLVVQSAASGVSALKRTNSRPLTAVGILAFVVLLVACTTVANLMTARAAAREREMALRVSIGAGLGRLVQLVLLESAWVALLASALGATLAWWSAPFIVSRISPPDNPARLLLPADWRIVAFGVLVTTIVTCVLGMLPAFRATLVMPGAVLKSRATGSRRPLMHALVGVQAAFCMLVLFIAALVVATFVRLAGQPLGFAPDRLLTIDVVAQPGQPSNVWQQIAGQLRAVPGVESVGLAGQAMLEGFTRSIYVGIDGGPPGDVLAHFVSISPGWLNAMGMSLVEGRDFRDGDSTPGVAIVSEEFVNVFLDGRNPIGRSFEQAGSMPMEFQIIGVVRNIRYRHLRDGVLPLAYVPFQSMDVNGAWRPASRGNFAVKVRSTDPLQIAPSIRRALAESHSGFRVDTIRTQDQLIDADVVRERLLAMLGLFFGAVALLVAAIGLYGVLHYSVLQRRREIGVRLALGAHAFEIARIVTTGAVAMVLVGSLAGIALGLGVARYLQGLFFEVSATDPAMLAIPFVAIAAATLLAIIPPVVRALQIDPRIMLRVE